jgi:hypothetical protein
MLSAAIMSLGIAASLVWLLACQPIEANFIWTAIPTWCSDLSALEYGRHTSYRRNHWLIEIAWTGLSTGFDAVIIWIAYAIIRQVGLDRHRKGALMAVFGMGTLGTLCW